MGIGALRYHGMLQGLRVMLQVPAAPPPAPGQGFGAPTRVQGGAAAPSEVRLARARLSSRLGKVALAIGWIPLIGWLVAAPLMLVGTVLGWMSNYNAPHPAARTALLINGAAGIVTFLSIWGVMAWAGTA